MSEAERKNKKNAFPLSIIARILVIFVIFLLALFVYMGIKYIKNSDNEALEKENEIKKITEEITYESKKAEELKRNKDEKNNEENIEELARNELGLIKKDEIVIKPR